MGVCGGELIGVHAHRCVSVVYGFSEIGVRVGRREGVVGEHETVAKCVRTRKVGERVVGPWGLCRFMSRAIYESGGADLAGVGVHEADDFGKPGLVEVWGELEADREACVRVEGGGKHVKIRQEEGEGVGGRGSIFDVWTGRVELDTDKCRRIDAGHECGWGV